MIWPPTTADYYVTIEGGTITIRGDNAVALVEHYATATSTFVVCLAQDLQSGLLPYAECVTERSAFLTSGDPVGRYVEVSPDS